MVVIQAATSLYNMFIVYQRLWEWVYITKENFSNLAKALVGFRIVKRNSSDGVYLNSKIKVITTFLFVIFFNEGSISFLIASTST